MIRLLTHKQHRNFTRLWLAQLISQFGDRIHQLALIGLVAERFSGSALDLAKVMSFTILPVFFLQPIAGVLVDRWDRRTMLFVCDIIRGGLVLLIPLWFFYWDSLIPVYCIVFLVFCFPRFYVPAKMSIVPEVVEAKYLLQANSLLTTTGMIAAGLGAALGAFIIEYCGARNGFFIDAGTFFVSALFVWHMRIPARLNEYKRHWMDHKKEIVKDIPKSLWQEIREGFRYIFTHKDIRLVMNLLFILFVAAGAVYVVIIVFIQQAFNSVTKDLGILAICLVAGLFLSVLAYGRWGQGVPWHKTIFSCLVSGGIMLLAFAIIVAHFPVLSFACVLAFIWGFTIGPVFIASNTIVHLVTDKDMQGKVFSTIEMVIHGAFLISMMLSSFLSEYIDHGWILAGVGAGLVVTGLAGIAKSKKFQKLAISTERGIIAK